MGRLAAVWLSSGLIRGIIRFSILRLVIRGIHCTCDCLCGTGPLTRGNNST